MVGRRNAKDESFSSCVAFAIRVCGKIKQATLLASLGACIYLQPGFTACFGRHTGDGSASSVVILDCEDA